jgi:hypothetical protein
MMVWRITNSPCSCETSTSAAEPAYISVLEKVQSHETAYK